MAGKFDPKLFFQDPKNVALYVPASELFGLLKRTLDLPSQWGALVKRSTGDHIMVPAGGEVDGADAEDVLFTRVTPVEVFLEEEGIVTRDRFRCRTELRLRLSVIPERSELLSFLKAIIGSHRVVQTHRLAQHLQPALRVALAQFAAERDAKDLVDGRSSEALSAALADAVQAPLFAAGLVLEGRPRAQFDSRTLRQVQRTQQEAARRRAEHDAARQVRDARDRAQSEHLDHLASLLSRLDDLAAESPDVELPDLIRIFSERERGELYEALFAPDSAATRTQWIVVAAGDELLFFAPDTLDTAVRRLTIADSAGPVRSVQTATDPDGRAVLLLGGSTGVYRLPIERAEPDLTLIVDPTPSVQGGFNAAVTVGDRVFASHSELGLYEWEVGSKASGRPRFESMTRDAKAIRAVQFCDGDLYCAIDDRVIRWPADEVSDRPTRIYTGSPTTITGLCPTPQGLFAGNVDGDILHWPVGHDTKPQRLHTGTHRAAESISLLASHGVNRLVYTDTSLHVHARVLGDNFTCRYEAGGQTLRRVEVAPDLLVATNDLRDRLICWTPGQPQQPSATIAVSRLTGRSVQDVCLVAEA